jgi:hypothetical protein
MNMKTKFLAWLRVSMIVVFLFSVVPAASAMKGSDSGIQTGFIRWRAADGGYGGNGGWTLSGVKVNTGGALEFDNASARDGSDPYKTGAYYGGNYYNAGDFRFGEATSPEITTPFNFTEAIASWNANTPAGSWIEVQFRAQYGTRWSKWYSLGIWASDDSTIQRHSVKLQGDTDGYVAVDTFVSTAKKAPTNKFQIKILLFSTKNAVPSVQNASVAYSTSAPKKVSTVSLGNSTNWGKLLEVPECSQMVYPDGGEVWCSPTSTSMVLGYWGYMPGDCQPRVRDAVAGVYDWIYDGHGNWPFNTAYAAANGYEAYVARFTSLDKAEEFVEAGVPVVMSLAWGKGDLTGSTIPSTNGHLLVLVGFDSSGNPIINDPAAATDEEVQVTYLRSEFESLWLETSGGTVYLIYPPDHPIPSLP